MANNLLSADLSDRTVRKHYLFTTTILDSFLTPSGQSPVGLTVDLAGNLYIAGYPSGTVFKMDGISSTVLDSISTWGNALRGITIDADGNLYTLDRTTNRLNKHYLFTTTILDSILLTNDPHGVTTDGTYFYYCDPAVGPLTKSTIFKLDGFTTTVLDSILVFDNRYDITHDGINLYSCTGADKELARHVGFSISESVINSPGDFPYAVAYENTAGRLNFEGITIKGMGMLIT